MELIVGSFYLPITLIHYTVYYIVILTQIKIYHLK